MERWRGRVALVTGASAGIGAAICKRSVKHGMTVIGCSRNLQKLQAVADSMKEGPGRMIALQCDVAKPQDVTSLFSRIREKHGRLDVCVNNAGLLYNAPLLTGDYQDWKAQLDVNVLGLCQVTQEAYQLMKESGVDDGQILHLNSMSGHRIANNANTHFYTATKYAVTALLEGLRQELIGEGSRIRIAGVSPGLVDTQLARTHMSSTNDMKILDCEDIADQIDFILSAPPHVQIHDILLRPIGQLV